jgi:hypothetical protein
MNPASMKIPDNDGFVDKKIFTIGIYLSLLLFLPFILDRIENEKRIKENKEIENIVKQKDNIKIDTNGLYNNLSDTEYRPYLPTYLR